jgi:hypothetical protein
MPSERDIARDLARYLADNPGVCAKGSVPGYTHLRCLDGEWRLVQYGGTHRRKYYVDGKVLDGADAEAWLARNPAKFVPVPEAGCYSGRNIWADATHQRVFTARPRCFWCGESDATTPLGTHLTHDHGEIHLCPDCHGSWKQAGELVATDGGTEAEPTADTTPLSEVDRCEVETLVTTVDTDDLPPFDDPADRESYLEMEREFARDDALATLATNILDEDAVSEATSLLWVDQAEVYCCCPAHYHEHRDGAWTGGTEHPHYERFKRKMYERLEAGAPCSFCKRERRREIEAQLDAQVTVTVDDGDTDGGDSA